MAIICPTVLAAEPHEFREQLERVVSFSNRIQIDLMDGVFAPTKSIELKKVWWPSTAQIDLHLMYQNPDKHIDDIVRLKPHLVIIHAESDTDHMKFAAHMHRHKIKAGIALLSDTPVEWVERLIHSFDHLLVFSGDLGRFGGEADLKLLSKARKAKSFRDDIEVGWDGGVNHENAKDLAKGGVDVLNVGGFIQRASNPNDAYATLKSSIA